MSSLRVPHVQLTSAHTALLLLRSMAMTRRGTVVDGYLPLPGHNSTGPFEPLWQLCSCRSQQKYRWTHQSVSAVPREPQGQGSISELTFTLLAIIHCPLHPQCPAAHKRKKKGREELSVSMSTICTKCRGNPSDRELETDRPGGRVPVPARLCATDSHQSSPSFSLLFSKQRASKLFFSNRQCFCVYILPHFCVCCFLLPGTTAPGHLAVFCICCSGTRQCR